MIQRGEITDRCVWNSLSTVWFWGYFHTQSGHIFYSFSQISRTTWTNRYTWIYHIDQLDVHVQIAYYLLLRTVLDYAYTLLHVCVCLTIHFSMTLGGHKYIQKLITLYMFDIVLFWFIDIDLLIPFKITLIALGTSGRIWISTFGGSVTDDRGWFLGCNPTRRLPPDYFMLDVLWTGWHVGLNIPYTL